MLTPWKKSYDQTRQYIKKQRHYFVNKGLSSQGCGFSSSHVWCESWTTKKAECRRMDAFELRCWRRLLRVPWTSRRSNQSILKEISPECSLEGLMLKLKLQYFGHLMWKADSFEKTVMLGKIEGRRRRDNRGWDGWMASPTQWTWVWINSGSWWWIGRPGMLQFMESQSWTRLSDWIELNWFAMKQWDWKPWSYFSECWVLYQIFHSSFTFIKGLFSSLLEASTQLKQLIGNPDRWGFVWLWGWFFLFVCLFWNQDGVYKFYNRVVYATVLLDLRRFTKSFSHKICFLRVCNKTQHSKN